MRFRCGFTGGIWSKAPLIVVAALMFIFSAGVASADVFIDTFQTTQTISTDELGPEPDGGGWHPTSGPGILGGTREMRLDCTAISLNNFTMNVGSGFFTYNQASTVQGWGEVRWAGMTSLDLTEEGNAIEIDLTSDQVSSLILTINGSSMASIALADTNVVQSFTILFSSFSDPSAFQGVDSILMRIPQSNSSSETDITIQRLEIVCIAEEPGISVSANPNPIPFDQSTSQLCWQADGATRVELSGPGLYQEYTQNLDQQNCIDVIPGNYVVTAWNECASNVRNITITKQGAPPPVDDDYPIVSPNPLNVPTLSQWGMLIFAGLMGLSGIRYISGRGKRRKK
ncbi:IPTL-CTERM sorting domain-containing protein [Desulfatiglans anilini]|uniref:IPTL-CTERM sorting domain-containing protein n=1 Tax=Desulfatiglans anilini TaxID=90728 RepID=UPI0003F84089|nr:IPTL-CTERM sorting domain-containing protein [Desulfatiglans anilini]